MIEVELKAKVERDEILDIVRKLENLGFKRCSKMEEIDTYFNGIDRDFRETDEALRVRKTVDLTGNVKYYLTYKGPKIDNISKTREEYQVVVNDGDVAKVILEKLGFKPLPPLKKIREIYKNSENITVSIDEVEGIGYFVEFEKTVDSEGEREEAIKDLMDLIKSLNINERRLIRLSYLELRDMYEKEK